MGRPQYPVAAPVPVEAYPDLPPVYNYQYGVNDEGYSNSVFSQSEQRDGANAGGEYRVNLPDGRVQIVTYTAGPEGYNATVTYEGEAIFPEEPAPGYKAAPLVKIAPAPVVKVAPVAAPAPVVKAVAAPIAPAYAPSGYHASPVNPAYSPKKYGYTVVATEEPEMLPVEEEAFEEPAPAKAEDPVVEAAKIASPDARYRYRFF